MKLCCFSAMSSAFGCGRRVGTRYLRAEKHNYWLELFDESSDLRASFFAQYEAAAQLDGGSLFRFK